MANPAAEHADELGCETADHVISTGRPVTECCRELGLNPKTVDKWVAKRRREISGEPDPEAGERELREAQRRMRGCAPNAKKRTTIPDPKAKPRPDLVRRDLAGPVPTCRLAGDITYLRTGEGWLYLATVIDLRARMAVGWSLSGRMTADIAAAALESAKSRGYVAGNAIFHSDRGAQYTSRALAERARANDVRLSCSRTGNCHDNAVAESFFATLKNEMYYRRSFATRADAKHAVIELIEAGCNRRRPHSTIGYQIPAKAMESFFERTMPESKALPMAA